MHFRPVVRRPKARRWILGLSILFLPFLSGGKVPVAQPSGGFLSGPSPDSAAFWLFLSDSAWTAGSFVGTSPELPGRVRTRSRWLRAISVEVPLESVPDLRSIRGVKRVVPVGSLRSDPGVLPGGDGWDGASEVPWETATQADSTYGGLGPFLDVMEIPDAHALGLRGAGTRVGLLDGLFRLSHMTVRGRPPLSVRDFVDGDGSVEPGIGELPGAASHGTALWSLVGGDWEGNLRGAAPGADVLLARVISDADPVSADEDRWVAGLEWLESQGARVVLSGIGFRNFEGGRYAAADLNGDVAPASLAADEAARRGVLVVAPVGNGGPAPQTLQSPADGDSVLAVGSVNPSGLESAFSARGPTSDGRRKPDLRAPGEGVLAATAEGDALLTEVQGTEYAGALLAGAAALFVEAYPERGPMAILEAFAASAYPADGSFGQVPRVAPAILFPDGVFALPLEEVDGEGRVTNLAPQFQWNVPTTHPLGLPVLFRLELSEDSLFQGVVLRDSVVGTFARRLQEPLPPRTRLFWRVQAVSTQGIHRAAPADVPILVPSWVALEVLNEPGGGQVSEPQPEFRWTAMPLSGPAGPFSFELQVLLDREGEVLQSRAGLTEDHFRFDEPLPFNLPLRWRVIATARNGVADTVSNAAPFVVTGGANPPVTILYQNFPNPFPAPEEGTWTTRIWFDLAEESRVELAVYDMRGRLVRSLIPGPGCAPVRLPSGIYGREGSTVDPCTAYTWDGRDDRGREVSAGVYLLRLRAGGVVEVRRVVYWP